MEDKLKKIREYLRVYGVGAISVLGNHEQEDLIKMIQEMLDEAFDDGKDTMQLAIRNKTYGLNQQQMIRLNELRKKYNLPIRL